jgi:uncharacterized surface protein with fasciclin (FAS1) repeats
MSDRIRGRAVATVAAAVLSVGLGASAIAQGRVVNVGGAPMYPTKNIIQNAINSKDHTTLVAAVKAGGLVDTLSGKGPFTVLKPENKGQLDQVLTYHVVPGKLSALELGRMVKAGGGKAVLKTVEGEPLTVMDDGGRITITDSKGDVATVTIADVNQSNGVIHVIDTVLLP